MQMNPISNWFRPKHVGFGWSPASWEGWGVIVLAVLAIGLIAGRFG